MSNNITYFVLDILQAGISRSTYYISFERMCLTEYEDRTRDHGLMRAVYPLHHGCYFKKVHSHKIILIHFGIRRNFSKSMYCMNASVCRSGYVITVCKY